MPSTMIMPAVLIGRKGHVVLNMPLLLPSPSCSLLPFSSCLQISDTTFEANGAAQRGSGGCISANGVMRLIVKSTTFQGCAAAGEAGAISAQGLVAGLVIHNCKFSRCNATLSGGALGLRNIPLSQISGTSFTHCRANMDGGAIRLAGSSDWPASFTTISNCSFRGGFVGASGGGIAVSGNAQLLVHATSFYNNTADLGPSISTAQTCSISISNSSTRMPKPSYSDSDTSMSMLLGAGLARGKGLNTIQSQQLRALMSQSAVSIASSGILASTAAANGTVNLMLLPDQRRVGLSTGRATRIANVSVQV